MPKFIENDEIEIGIKATKEFTDREEPRKVFWDKYNMMASEMNGENPIQVVAYYGFGGIGKSSLLHKLNEEVTEKAPNSKVKFIDFEKLVELNNNILDILKVIRQDLKEKYKFSFPIFDLVTYVYETKMGKTATKPELNSIFDENKELGFLKDVISDIPLIGTFAKVIYYADASKNLIQDRLKNRKLRQRLLDIENLSVEEIKEHLAYYFSIDLKENLKNEKAPFVFFIDTYEKLVNELTQVGDPLKNDLWLRSSEGLICRVPNVIWVIAGREKLKWQDIDESWEGTLEQHLLGTLSFQDTLHFLQVAGIDNEELMHQIYDLTHGTPMYLDMCVDTYIKLKEKGETPTIDDFGGDTTKLIKRFLMYMNDTERDFSTMLAYIPEWTDDTIEGIAVKMNGTFSFSLYEKVKRFSFIVNENGRYKMHETIRDVIVANTPEIIRTKYQKIMQDNANDKINEAIKTENERINRILSDVTIEDGGLKANSNLENKIAFIDNYESKKAYKEVIENLYAEILDEANENEFESKASFLLEKINEFEELFNEPIYLENIEKIKHKNSKFLPLLKAYEKEMYSLDIIAKYLIEKYEKLQKLYGKYSEETLLPIKHYLRWNHETSRDKEVINRISEIITSNIGKNNLYYIALCASNRNECYGSQEEFFEKIREYSNAKLDKFYIKLILEASKQENVDAYLMEKTATPDIDYYLYYDSEPAKKEAIQNFSIAINALKRNPNLLDFTVLKELYETYTSYYLFYDGNPLNEIMFEYIYPIRYIALKTSNQEIIDCFLNIFKSFIGGDKNETRFVTNSEEILEKTLKFLNELKAHYEELYGVDHYNVNEMEDYIAKFDKLTPEKLDRILKSKVEKYGIGDEKTRRTFITYVNEIKNRADLVNRTIEKSEEKGYSDVIMKYAKDIIIAYKKDNKDNNHASKESDKYLKNMYEDIKWCLRYISSQIYDEKIKELDKILEEEIL